MVIAMELLEFVDRNSFGLFILAAMLIIAIYNFCDRWRY